MSTTTAPMRPATNGVARSTLLLLLLLALVAAAAVGVNTAVQLVSHRAQRVAEVALASPGRGDLVLGEPVRTSFGALTASDALINNGLSTADLGGMSHGVSALVAAGRAQVEVTVTVANTRKRAFLLAASQFALITRKGAGRAVTVKPSGTTLLAGPLPARASVDSRVSFVVPTDGASMWLQYTDPGLAQPIRVALGRTDKISTPAGHVH